MAKINPNYRAPIGKIFKVIFLALTQGLAKVVVGLIRLYQIILSPFLGNCCRFYPSCSVYAQEAILRWGMIRGGWLVSKRILSCHPWHTGGYDPVPDK